MISKSDDFHCFFFARSKVHCAHNKKKSKSSKKREKKPLQSVGDDHYEELFSISCQLNQ